MVEYLPYLAIRHIFFLYVHVGGWLGVSCSKYTFSSAFWCHISSPHTHSLLILWPNPMNFILFNFVHWIWRRIKTLILKHVSFFFSSFQVWFYRSTHPTLARQTVCIAHTHTWVCIVWRWPHKPNKIKRRKNRNHTNRIEFKNDNIIIRKRSTKYWIDWKPFRRRCCRACRQLALYPKQHWSMV